MCMCVCVCVCVCVCGRGTYCPTIPFSNYLHLLPLPLPLPSVLPPSEAYSHAHSDGAPWDMHVVLHVYVIALYVTEVSMRCCALCNDISTMCVITLINIHYKPSRCAISIKVVLSATRIWFGIWFRYQQDMVWPFPVWYGKAPAP